MNLFVVVGYKTPAASAISLKQWEAETCPAHHVPGTLRRGKQAQNNPTGQSPYSGAQSAGQAGKELYEAKWQPS